MPRRIRLGIVLCLVIQSLTEAECTKPKEEDWKFNEVYVSQTNGVDRPSCGTELQPCKSISAGVWRADFNVHVYIDGTGTQKSPYPCQSSSLQLQGIYVNKSLELIGIKSPVNVKCHDGLGIRFNSSDLNSSQTIIKVMNILFLESPLHAQDVNLRIDNCNFVSGLIAITLTQSSRSVALSFTNSSCLNTNSCIIAESSNTRKDMQGILSIHLIDSNVRGTPITPTLSSNALGIHVVSSDVNPGSIFCDITLQNVIFTDNYIGPKGVIHVVWDSGLSSLCLDGVLFYGNDFVSRSPSNIILIQSYDYEVILNHSTFSLITSGRVMRLDAKNSSKLSILNSHFTGGLPTQGNEGLLFLDSKHDSQVTIVNTTFTNIRNHAIGSCMHLKSETASVQIENSAFVNNHGECAGIFWMLAKESLAVVCQGGYFESNGADGPGGLASCLGKVVNITMLDSKIDGSHASGPGGVFDIGFNGCGSQEEIFNANLVFKNMSIEHCSCYGPGGIAVVDSTNGSITVYRSFFNDIKATAPGAVFSATINPAFYNASFSIEIFDALFKNSSTSAPAGVIAANRVEKLLLDRVTIDSAVAGQGPGGALLIDGRNNLNINITNSTFKNCQASAPGGVLYLTADKPVRMWISNSIFKSSVSSGPGGCLYLYIKQCHVNFTNVNFRNCHATGSPGGAIHLQSASTSKLTFDSCSFVDNTAQVSVGGAVFLDLPKDYISDPGCIKQQSLSQTIPHRSWKYNSNVEFIDTVFANNTAQTGGALMLSRGQHTFQACSFRNNFANLRGGHIFSDLDSTSIRIYNTKFLQTRKTQVLKKGSDTMTFRITSFIETNSQGPLILINSSLEFQPLGDVKPLVMLSQGGFVSFGENNRTSLVCPRGSNLQIVNFTNVINTEYKSQECRIILSVLQFNCKSCGLGYYSLQHGRSAGLQKIGSFQCLPCPYGAECLHNIVARENFWGHNVPQPNPPALNFTNCPTGYCKHPDEGDPLEYNSCHGNRSGILCGECKRGYTETLLSPSCRRESECQDKWLWGVAALMLLLMATYLVHKPRLSLFFRKQIFWFQKSNDVINDEGSSSQHEDDVTLYHDKGYLKIVFYFYQVANLLLISTSYNSIVERYLLQPVIGLFSFQFRLSSKGFLCPFPGLTVVTKELLFASQVFGVSFMILFCYLCHFLFCKCVSRTPPNLGPYLGALLETMLLGYAVFANTAFKLLRCRTIGDESRLFISGQVACYQWWQYSLMVFVGLLVVPFILMLGLGSHWLNKGSISVKEFLLGCALPLPYLMYKLASHFFCQRRQPSEEPVEWRTSMKNVLFGPFRRPEGDSWGALYWESVLTGRRLIIITIFVSLSDPLCKQLLLTFVCVFILFHHTIVRPFRKATANAAEMASLLGLVAIAIINTFKASFLTTGQNPQGPLQSSAEILDWTQVIILSIVPVLFCLLIIVSVVSQVIRLIAMMGILMFERCCKRFFTKESRPLLEPTKYYDSVGVERSNHTKGFAT